MPARRRGYAQRGERLTGAMVTQLGRRLKAVAPLRVVGQTSSCHWILLLLLHLKLLLLRLKLLLHLNLLLIRRLLLTRLVAARGESARREQWLRLPRGLHALPRRGWSSSG